jgi:hypothetical protein
MNTQQLTEHFSLAELTESDTATRLGIDNTPPDSLLDNLKQTAVMAEAVRTILGDEAGHEIYMTVTSGFRCEALEKALCQKDYESWCSKHQLSVNAESWKRYFSRKAHPQGRALDFRAPAFGVPYHIVRILQKHPELIAQIDQIILEGVTVKNEGWVHIGWSNYPRHQVMTALFDANGTPHYMNELT